MILKVNEKDINVTGDTLNEEKSIEFVDGRYGYIESEGSICSCSVKYGDDGLPMVFIGAECIRLEAGKYYKHSGGGFLHVLGRLDTTMWGKNALIAERSGHSYDLIAVGDDVDSAVNWSETTKEEWSSNFS